MKRFTIFSLLVLSLIAACESKNPISPSMVPSFGNLSDFLGDESGGEAQPAEEYLFDLNREQILATMVFYHSDDFDPQKVLTDLSEPFDCSRFGDLCDEVGFENAKQVIRSTWNMAHSRVPFAQIDEAMSSQIDELHEQWLNERFPEGIPDDSPFWGEIGTSSPLENPQLNRAGKLAVSWPLTCEGKTSTKTSGDKKYRIRQKSGVVNTSIYHQPWSSISFYKKNSKGNFNKTKAEYIYEQHHSTWTHQTDHFGDKPGGKPVKTSSKKNDKKIKLSNSLHSKDRDDFRAKGYGLVKDSRLPKTAGGSTGYLHASTCSN